jgi:hypothetical protein
MEKIVAYLEKLGYTVEEQGKLEKYLVVFKNNRPIGFILPDLTVKLVSDAGEQNNIREIIDYVNKNQGLESVGASEFLLASYRGSQMTTFFDTGTMHPAYVTYVRTNTGEVKNTTYKDFDTAMYFFITQTQMIDLRKFAVQHESLSVRLRTWLINYLLSKQRAEQH